MAYHQVLKRTLYFAAAITTLAITALSASPVVRAASAADLIIPDITLSPPAPAIDDTVTVTVTVKNQGSTAAPSSQVICYLDESILATNTVPALNAGGLATTTFSFRAQAGGHIIRAQADPGNFVPESDETNNTRTFTFTSLAPDLVVSSVSWLPSSPSRGDSVTISVTVKNQGSSRSRSTGIVLYIDGNSRGYQDIPALEPASSITKTYHWVAQTGQHAIRAVVDEAGQVKESNESNNESTLTFTTLPPDLIIQKLSWQPENPSRNDTVTFTATIKNQGQGRADACQLVYSIDENYQSVLSVGSLEAGASSNVTFTWVVRADTHTAKVTVDFNNTVAESDENNNSLSTKLFASLPDLTVTDITWEPKSPGAGDEITFTVTIKNQGTGRADPSHLNFYVAGKYSAYADTPALEPGKTATAKFSWVASDGTYTIKAVTDGDYYVNESDEFNNITTRTLAITPPDIAITGIAYSPQSPVVGEIVSFTTNITNRGGGTAGGFYLAYYLDDELLAFDFVAGIRPGDNVSRTYNWQLDNRRHTFKVIADANQQVYESNEGNNEMAVTVVPRLPDITVGVVTWSPAEMSEGSRLTFAIRIENRGSQNAGAFRIAYYTDGQPSGYNDIEQLGAGATTTVYFPWTVASGSHSIIITADASDQVPELDETNNSKVVNIPLPELIITEITSSPQQVVFEEPVTFTATVRNAGGSVSPATQAILAIDGKPTATTRLPAIDPAASATVSFTWQTTAGEHDITILVDSGDLVTEADETNNEKTFTFATLTPDLIIQDIAWQMESPLTSDAATITITIKNQGTATARASRLEYTIDNLPKEGRDIPEIAAGQSFAFTMTAMLRAGDHTVKATADATSQLPELDEANNTKSLTFSTVVADLAIKSITLPQKTSAGNDITVTVTVENRGKEKSTATRLELYVNGKLLAGKEIGEIGIGALASVDFAWRASAGQYEISACIDPEGRLEESNKTNNVKTLSLAIPATQKPEKEPAAVLPVAHEEGSFLGSYWWALLLLALALGSGSFLMMYKSYKKK